MRYTVRYQFATYSGTKDVEARDDDDAIAKVRAWVHSSSGIPMAYESYKVVSSR